MDEGLIFADGRMLTAVEAAAYIKELKAESKKWKEEYDKLREQPLEKIKQELREEYETLQKEIWNKK